MSTEQHANEEMADEADTAAIAAAERDTQDIRIGIHNLANIYLHTGNHEVRTVVKEVARIFCVMIGEEHGVFFPESGPIRESNPNVGITLPAPTGGYGWPGQAVHATPPQPRSGLSVPGMPPSPFAPPVSHNPQDGGFPTAGGDPNNPTGARMVVVDPGPYGGGPGPADLARMQGVPVAPGAVPGALGAPLVASPAAPVPGGPFRPRHGG